MNGLPFWEFLLIVLGPTLGGYVLMLTVFWLLGKRELRRERRGGTLDLTYLSRSVDRPPARLYDQEADEAVRIADELHERAREARG